MGLSNYTHCNFVGTVVCQNFELAGARQKFEAAGNNAPRERTTHYPFLEVSDYSPRMRREKRRQAASGVEVLD